MHFYQNSTGLEYAFLSQSHFLSRVQKQTKNKENKSLLDFIFGITGNILFKIRYYVNKDHRTMNMADLYIVLSVNVCTLFAHIHFLSLACVLINIILIHAYTSIEVGIATHVCYMLHATQLPTEL